MYYNDTCNNNINILIDLQYSENITNNIIHNNILLQNNINSVSSNDNSKYNYLRTSCETPSNELIQINFISDLQYLSIFLTTKNSIFKLPVFPNEISNNYYNYIFIEEENDNVNDKPELLLHDLKLLENYVNGFFVHYPYCVSTIIDGDNNYQVIPGISGEQKIIQNITRGITLYDISSKTSYNLDATEMDGRIDYIVENGVSNYTLAIKCISGSTLPNTSKSIAGLVVHVMIFNIFHINEGIINPDNIKFRFFNRVNNDFNNDISLNIAASDISGTCIIPTNVNGNIDISSSDVSIFSHQKTIGTILSISGSEDISGHILNKLEIKNINNINRQLDESIIQLDDLIISIPEIFRNKYIINGHTLQLIDETINFNELVHYIRIYPNKLTSFLIIKNSRYHKHIFSEPSDDDFFIIRNTTITNELIILSNEYEKFAYISI